MITLSGYKVEKLIHQGKRSSIYRAIRQIDDARVIIKTLRSKNPPVVDIALLTHEFEITRDLNLSHVIKVYEFIEEHGGYFLVEEDLQGMSVADYFKPHPIKQLDVFFKIAMQMISAIEQVHQSHIIHKDIKPANFIINPDSLLVKLTDFNFSTKYIYETQELTPPEKLEGTLEYIAPEQTGRMNMHIDQRSDFYSLGITFFEMLTGSLPYLYSDPLELIHAHLALPIPKVLNVNFSVPASLEMIIQKLMSKDPSDRYQSCAGIQFDLQKCIDGGLESFRLGDGEIYDRLNLSQKLYGRAEEEKEILEAYNRASQGSVEMLMIYGNSGIGKTSLINQVHKPMTRDKAYFISGKFDQFQNNGAYTAISQALNQFAKVMMSEPEDRFESLKTGIEQSLGDSLQEIIEIAPDLEEIFGDQAELETLPLEAMQNRRFRALSKFLKVIATVEHPLVIFIDDLQWIDSASVKLLDYIVQDTDLSHIVFIGAYRDNEVDEHHDLRLFFKEKRIQFLPLKPLTIFDLEAFLSDSLKQNNTAPLAKLVHKRTEGNPFYFKEIIKEIYFKNFLSFNNDIRMWLWNIEAIGAIIISTNVIDLLLAKFEALSLDVKVLLQIAACFGNRFSIKQLTQISGHPHDLILNAIKPAIEQELVIFLSADLAAKTTYQFIHDRVQQVVYESINNDEKSELHLKIARLLSHDAADHSNKKLFELIEHYNKALPLLTHDEKMNVANLNLQASILAKSASAYSEAINYLNCGLSLTEEKDWKDNYNLLYHLHLERCKIFNLMGESVEALKINDFLLAHVNELMDQIDIYQLRFNLYVEQGNHQSAWEVAFKSLDLLHFKVKKNPSILDLLYQFVKLQMKHKNFDPGLLDKQLKEIDSQKNSKIFELLRQLITLSITVDTRKFPVYIILVMMNLIFAHGISNRSVSVIFVYGLVILNFEERC